MENLSVEKTASVSEAVEHGNSGNEKEDTTNTPKSGVGILFMGIVILVMIFLSGGIFVTKEVIPTVSSPYQNTCYVQTDKGSSVKTQCKDDGTPKIRGKVISNPNT